MLHIVTELWISTHFIPKLIDNSYIMSIYVWYCADYLCWLFLSNLYLSIVIGTYVTPILGTFARWSSCMEEAYIAIVVFKLSVTIVSQCKVNWYLITILIAQRQ